jgi:hypothetical protein
MAITIHVGDGYPSRVATGCKARASLECPVPISEQNRNGARSDSDAAIRIAYKIALAIQLFGARLLL